LAEIIGYLFVKQVVLIRSKPSMYAGVLRD
jgi:hypothetical protein